MECSCIFFNFKCCHLRLSSYSTTKWVKVIKNGPCKISERQHLLNPFLANIPILYPLKTPENRWFSGVFKGYKIGTLATNGLKKPYLINPFLLNIRFWFSLKQKTFRFLLFSRGSEGNIGKKRIKTNKIYLNLITSNSLKQCFYRKLIIANWK